MSAEEGTVPVDVALRDMYLIGAVRTLLLAAESITEDPDVPPADYLRAIVDSILLDSPHLIDKMKRSDAN